MSVTNVATSIKVLYEKLIPNSCSDTFLFVCFFMF